MTSTSLQYVRPAEEELLLKEKNTKRSIVITPSTKQSNKKAFGNNDFNSKPSSEPVRLTPAWEECNLPSDILNFKTVTMERAELEVNRPRDKYLLVYFILLIHGIGTLMPWNIFINAKDFYEDYKFNPNNTNGIDTTDLRENYLTILGVVSQVPNLVFNWLNIFISFGGNLTSRIVYSIAVEVIIFIITEVLVLVDSSQWPYQFFIITMVLVFILNVASGIYQNTLYGIASKLPPQYTGAVILGNVCLISLISNICGISISLLNILARTLTQDHKTKAIYYFLIALIILFVCFDTYFLLPLTKFYKHFSLQFEKAQEERKQLDIESITNKETSTPYWKIFKGCSLQCFNVFFTFVVTLSLFPKVQSNIKRTDPDFFIAENFYVDIMCFISFSVFATLGNLLATVIQWPGPKKLHYAVIIRCAFIPLFLLCNYNMLDKVVDFVPEYKIRQFSPIFGDVEFGIFGILMAFTSGYFSSLSMMYCSQSAPTKYISIAGMFGGACLVTGIFIGLLIPFIWPYIVFE